MSMANLVESARKATAPIVGIPLEGEKPFAVRRDLLVNTLKGLKVIDAGVQLDLQTGKPSELVVYASGENVKAVRRFKPLDLRYLSPYAYSLRLHMAEWAEKQRAKRKQPKVKLSGREKEIAKQVKRLEREKSKLYIAKNPPLHPLLPTGYRYEGNYLRESELQWHNEKPKRKQLAAIAGMVLKSKITSNAGYKMLRDARFDFVKFSEQPTHRGQRAHDNPWSYWKHIPEFVRGMMGKVPRTKDDNWRDTHEPQADGTPSNEFTRHNVARAEYLATKREAQTIDNQILALRELATPTIQ
jgi:hypothetical protein